MNNTGGSEPFFSRIKFKQKCFLEWQSKLVRLKQLICLIKLDLHRNYLLDVKASTADIGFMSLCGWALHASEAQS